MGTKVYLTGASGFLGRALVDRLALGRPAVSRIDVPIRAKRTRSPRQRHALLFGHLGEKVQFAGVDEPIPHDTTVVVLNAYNVRFTGKLKDTLEENVEPMLRLLSQCRDLPSLRKIVIVSTAYVNPPKPAKYCEGLVPIGGVDDAVELYENTLAGRVTLTSLSAAPLIDEHFAANPYVCSKRLMEHVVVQKFQDLPVTFVRPSMVGVSCDGNYGSEEFGALLFAKMALAPFPAVLNDTACHDNVTVCQVVDGIAETVVDLDAASGPHFVPLTSGSQLKSSEYMEAVNPNRRTLWVTSERSWQARSARWLEWLLLRFLVSEKVARTVTSVYSNYDYVFRHSWDFPSTIPLPGNYFAMTRKLTLQNQKSRREFDPPSGSLKSGPR